MTRFVSAALCEVRARKRRGNESGLMHPLLDVGMEQFERYSKQVS